MNITTSKPELYSEDLFLNFFDSHLLQQIFRQLVNPIIELVNDPIIELVNQNPTTEQNLKEYTKEDLLENYVEQFNNYLSFSLVCKQFNLVSKNALFQFKIFEEKKIEDIPYSIYLKLNYVKQDIILYYNKIGSKISSKQDLINRILIHTSGKGFYDLIKPLILNGADIHFEADGKNGFEVNSSSESCEAGNLKTTKKLIKHGADINWFDGYQNSILHYACNSNNLNLVKYLIDIGFNINIQNAYNQTPLFNACRNGNLDIVKYLISLGADINYKSGNKKEILFEACYSTNSELIQYLLDLGFDINKKKWDGTTCLVIACLYANLETIKFLISKGADLSIKYEGDLTLLQHIKNSEENFYCFLLKLSKIRRKEAFNEIIKELEKYF